MDRLEVGQLYPISHLELPLRELLRRSQTDVTPDPHEGYSYGVAAYDKAVVPTVDSDHTAAGEAASKVELRATQAGMTYGITQQWWRVAKGELTEAAHQIPGHETERHLVAAHITHGRSLALRALRQGPNDQPILNLEDKASDALREAYVLAPQYATRIGRLALLHDPYASMASRHYATFEAIRSNGNTSHAAGVALHGMWQALLCRYERGKGWHNHQRFVAKQVAQNAVALFLAATRQAATTRPRLENRRQAAARKSLG